jgi:dienelactone hydrolase
MVYLAVTLGLLAIASGADPKPVKGPYTAESSTYNGVSSMDSSDRSIVVVAPKEAGTYPLVVFMHGFNSGDPGSDYKRFFEGLVSFGYIIAAPRACNSGCKDDKVNLPGDPKGFGHYYKQQLLAIDWAKEQNKNSSNKVFFGRLDFSHGVGIGGHSMGGQATVFSASGENASSYNIAAAVMVHAFTHKYPAPKVPFLAMTGTNDLVAPHKMTESYYNAAGADSTKGLVNKIGANHHEASSDYNPLLPQFAASWFKLHINNVTSEFGFDFDEMIYGKGATSICGGGDGGMKKCEVHR